MEKEYLGRAYFVLFVVVTLLIYKGVQITINYFSEQSMPNTIEFHSVTAFDSIFVDVCGIKTKLFNHKEFDIHDSAYIHSGNVTTPKSGNPCSVEFLIFRNSEILKVPAPDFNCQGCAVAGHQYIFDGTNIKYKLRH